MAAWLFIRLDFEGKPSLGPVRIGILEAIDRFGSVADAAKAVGMTYRQTWFLVHEMNKRLPEPPVQIRRSGRSSGAILTPSGKAIVVNFRKMERLAYRSLKKYCDAIELLVGADPKSEPPVPRRALVIDLREKDDKETQRTAHGLKKGTESKGTKKTKAKVTREKSRPGRVSVLDPVEF